MWIVRVWVSLTWVVLCVWAVLAVPFFVGQPEPEVDYLAQLNAEVTATPEDERAWPVYREALLELRAMPDAERFGHLVGRAWPGDAEWPEMVALLEQRQEALATVRSAAGREHLGRLLAFELGPEELALYPQLAEDQLPGDALIYDIWLPHLRDLRYMGRAVTSDLHAAAEAGDVERLLANSEALSGLAAHGADDQQVIGDLVGMSIDALHRRAVGELLVSGGLDLLNDDQLERLQARLEDDADVSRLDYEGQRLILRDLLQKAYATRPEGRATWSGTQRMHVWLGILDPEMPNPSNWQIALFGPVVAAFAVPREDLEQATEAIFEQWQIERRVPAWEQWETAATQLDDTWWGIRHFPVHLSVVGLDAARLTEQRNRDMLRGVAVALSLERYRRDHGRYPPERSLEALVPGYLRRVPVCSASGWSMRWVLREGRPVVYGFGGDGDDDGGRVPEGGRREAFRPPGEAGDGDWVVYPAG
jgi:hypothetical protein